MLDICAFVALGFSTFLQVPCPIWALSSVIVGCVTRALNTSDSMYLIHTSRVEV